MSGHMWFMLAVAAALFWGIDYSFGEQVYRHVSVIGALAITTTAAGIILGVVAYISGSLKNDLHVLAAQPRTLLYLLISGIAFILADLLIGTSISVRNATLASLVEMSYPFFVAAFGYLLFGERQLSLGIAIGGTLIFAGLVAVYTSK